MKRTPLKRGTSQLKRSGFKQKPTIPMKRTRIRVAGHSTVADLKKEIQALVREIVMIRDGGCVLRRLRRCGAEVGMEGFVFQADHLISRSNSATFADTRLIVCVCRSCHGWKSLGSNLRKRQYDDMVRLILPKERVALWDRCEEDSWRPSRTGAADWKMEIIALKSELNKIRNDRK